MPWSHADSARGARGPWDLGRWRELADGRDWGETLTRPDDEQALARFRAWTNHGRPLGSDTFISKLERVLGRRLQPLVVARPSEDEDSP